MPSTLSHLSTWWTSHQAEIALAACAALLLAFVWERFPPAVIALGGAGFFLITGALDTDDALSVFSNPAPLTIAAMFVLSGALVRTGALEWVATRLLAVADTRPRLALVSLLGGALMASAFMNNTPVVLVLIPILMTLAERLSVAPQRLLIPLSFVAVLGGTCTLIGSSTNLLVDGVGQRLGQPAFTIFEISGVGLITAAGGILLLMLLTLALPARSYGEGPGEGGPIWFLSELTIGQESSAIGRTLAEIKALKPRGVKVIALRRQGASLPDREEVPIIAGDRILMRASPEEMLTLAERSDFAVGLSLRSSAGQEREVFEVGIVPNSSSVGSSLSDLGWLSRFPVRVLGVSRMRHHAGPDLQSLRIKPGDRLLVRATAATRRAMQGDPSLLVTGAPAARGFRRNRILVAVATLVLVVLLAAFGVLPIVVLSLIGIPVILLTRCLDLEEAWEAIDGSVLLLIFSMLVVGRALENSGGVDLIVGFLAPLLADAGPFVLILGVYALSSLLTELISNNAVAVILTPLVLSLAEAAAVDPRTLIVAVMFGASASFATPIGYQTNTLVYSAGNYRFVDFLRIGVPMNVGVGVIASYAIYRLFPPG